MALADGGEELLEAGAGYPRAGPSEIVIDHLDRGPAELARAIGERVLPTSALRIVEQLLGGGLAHVDDRLAREVVRRDLRHHRSPRSCLRRPSALRSVALEPAR